MPKKSNEGHFTKIQDSDWGRCGFDLRIYTSPESRNNPLLLLKGGLGDAGSHSLRPVTDAILDLTHGKMTVGTVGTLRPFSAVESLRILLSSTEHSRARNQRMHSMRRAYDKAIELTGSRFVLLGGQSEGGITAVDTGIKILSKKSQETKPNMAVVTIDTPGVYTNLEHSGFPLKGLVDLAAHCAPTFAKLSAYEKYRLFKDNVMNLRNLFELPYLLGEVDYLKTIGISDEIQALRLGGVAVGHIFHGQDIVEGAVSALEDESAVVFPGTHLTFMEDPEPVAEVLVNMAYELFESPSNVINLSQMSSYYTPDSLVA